MTYNIFLLQDKTQKVGMETKSRLSDSPPVHGYIYNTVDIRKKKKTCLVKVLLIFDSSIFWVIQEVVVIHDTMSRQR